MKATLHRREEQQYDYLKLELAKGSTMTMRIDKITVETMHPLSHYLAIKGVPSDQIIDPTNPDDIDRYNPSFEDYEQRSGPSSTMWDSGIPQGGLS